LLVQKNVVVEIKTQRNNNKRFVEEEEEEEEKEEEELESIGREGERKENIRLRKVDPISMSIERVKARPNFKLDRNMLQLDSYFWAKANVDVVIIRKSGTKKNISIVLAEYAIKRSEKRREKRIPSSMPIEIFGIS